MNNVILHLRLLQLNLVSIVVFLVRIFALNAHYKEVKYKWVITQNKKLHQIKHKRNIKYQNKNKFNRKKQKKQKLFIMDINYNIWPKFPTNWIKIWINLKFHVINVLIHSLQVILNHYFTVPCHMMYFA